MCYENFTKLSIPRIPRFSYLDIGPDKLRQVRLHLNVKLFNGIRMTGFVIRLFCII